MGWWQGKDGYGDRGGDMNGDTGMVIGMVAWLVIVTSVEKGNEW